MDTYLYSSTYQELTSPTTEPPQFPDLTYDAYDNGVVDPTQPTEETFTCSNPYYPSSAMEIQQSSSATWQDPPSFSEETARSTQVPSTDSYPDSSSRMAKSRRATNLPSNSRSAMCIFAECGAKDFKRDADLQRHYRSIHGDEAHYCDHPKCTRVSEPFSRRDHLRDHLRGYHREDIGKRGTIANEESLEDRYYPNNWWRCSRCLIRVYVAKDKFKCPECKNLCESKRVEKRMEKHQEKRRRH